MLCWSSCWWGVTYDLFIVVVTIFEVNFDHIDLFCVPYVARVVGILVVVLVFDVAYERC